MASPQPSGHRFPATSRYHPGLNRVSPESNPPPAGSRVVLPGPGRTLADMTLPLHEPVRPLPASSKPVRSSRAKWLVRSVLLLGVLLTAGAQIYIHHQKALWDSAVGGNSGAGGSGAGSASPQAAGPGGGSTAGSQIQISSPAGPVQADLLRLNWTAVPGADHYLLGIKTIAGGVIVDQLPVREPYWTSTMELLPAMAAGDYTWQVAAVNPAGQVTARSADGAFHIE